MKTKFVSHFAEVRNDYTDDQNLTHIDAWETADDNKEGQTVALVDRDTKKVIFFDNIYRNNPEIKEAIKEVLNSIDEEKEYLIDGVIGEIIKDIKDEEAKDISALFELLTFCPKENLIQYLPEEKWEQFR